MIYQPIIYKDLEDCDLLAYFYDDPFSDVEECE